MDHLLHDLKYALRCLRHDPGYTATVWITLTVCIAANTATFALVHSVLLRPLPIPGAERIVLMANRYPKAGVGALNTSATGDYFDRRVHISALQEQALFRESGGTLEIGGLPAQVPGMQVTPSFFPLVGVVPSIGRPFTLEEGEPGNGQKVILSAALWRQIYSGDPSAVGRELRIGGRAYTVTGVMPDGFVFVNPEVRFWVPLTLGPEDRNRYHSNNWQHVGRLRPGATLEQVQAQIDALNAAHLVRFPQFKELLVNAGFHTKVEPLQHVMVRDVEAALYLLWGGAVFVLFIGALNLANLALARATARRKEMVTRLALGAGRGRLGWQMALESMLAATAGGISGLLLGGGILRALAVLALDRFPRASEVALDGTAAALALATSIAAGVFIGLTSLPHIWSDRLSGLLSSESRSGTADRGARQFRRVLASAEIGFAFVLLAGAGLLLASFHALLRVDAGFTAAGVVTGSTSAPQASYPNVNDLRILVNRSLESIRRLPGVSQAGVTTSIPFGGSYSDSVLFAEGYEMKPGESVVSPHQLRVTPGYFQAMSIGLVRGRYFDHRDVETAPYVVIVDEKLARRFWPGRDPIGRRVYLPQNPSDPARTDANTRWYTVIGVVRPVRLDDLAGGGNPVGAYYFPFAQSPSRGFTFAVKAHGEARGLEQALRAEIARIDPQLALFDIRTMTQRTELSLSTRRTAMLLAMAFAAVALFLAAIGIYGVLAHLVAQRRREIGIRMALGSTGAAVVRMVLREGLALVGTGIALGLAGSALLRRNIESQIYGVQPFDTWVIGSVIAVLGSIAMGACAAPARRAARVDPVTVLSE